MAKKIVDGKEIEVEEEDASTETEQNTNTGEKKFTQEDLNKLLATEKRKWQTKYDFLQIRT